MASKPSGINVYSDLVVARFLHENEQKRKPFEKCEVISVLADFMVKLTIFLGSSTKLIVKKNHLRYNRIVEKLS